MERRGPSHLGPYGHACMSCFKAKCKCVACPDGPGCQRCHRLKKACQPSDSSCRRTTFEKKYSDARIIQLEKKLDGLISRLEMRNAPNSDQAPTRTDCSKRTAQVLDSENLGPSLNTFTAKDKESQHTEEYTDTNDDKLSIFRSRMLPHFPFIHLPPQLTAHQLGVERPFLLRAIVCVASQRDKAAQSSDLRRAICAGLLLEETDRMDLLLGLLTYLSWGWDHSKFMSRLMLQAVSLACESDNPNSGGMDTPEMRALFQPGVEADYSPTTSSFLERHRVVLGCFVLSSAVSAYLSYSIDTLRWTPQMDEGLAVLSASRDCPTDAAFAVQVRLQLLGQQAVHIRQQQMEQRYIQNSGVPALTSLIALQTELQELRVSLPVTVTGLSHHLAHLSATELVINETRYAVDSSVPFMVNHFSAIASRGVPPKNGERGRCLWQCIDAIKTCTDALLALSIPEFAGISLVQWSQLSRSVVVLHRLTTDIEDPCFDLAAVHAVIDMPGLLDRIAEKLGLAARVAGEKQEPEEVLTGIADRIREFCVIFRGRAGQGINFHLRPGSTAKDLLHIPVSDYLP